MTDKVQLIKEEIERRIKEGSSKNDISEGALALNLLLDFIDSLPKEHANNGLEEEITKCYNSRNDLMMTRKQFGELIHHFVEWQKQKSMQDFMEKAEEFFNKELFTRFSGEEHRVASNKCMNLQQFIEQFKNYMKNDLR